MAVTDLTGYIWYGNQTLSYNLDSDSFPLDFISNGTTYSTIAGGPRNTSLIYNLNTIVYANSAWNNEAYRTIKITGGLAARDTLLISWLEDNGILLPGDLTGYTWTANNVLTITSSVGFNSIYFTSNNSNFDRFQLDNDSPKQLYYVYAGTYTTAYYYMSGEAYWNDDNYKIVSFTGGSNATNSDLIVWLGLNGTLAVPQPTVNTYEITHSLTNLTKGNITLQITPDNGYTYPTSLTISNGTIVSYDNTTGVAVINGDDTTVVSGECVAQPSGYSVTFAASGNWQSSGDAYIYIYDGYWTDQQALLLLEQHPADKSAFPMTLQVSSGVCGIYISAVSIDGSIVSNDYNINDYMGLSPTYDNNIYIDKDGTINLDIVDWAD